MLTITIILIGIYYIKNLIKKFHLIINDFKYCPELTEEYKEKIFKLKNPDELNKTRNELLVLYHKVFYDHHKKTIKLLLDYVNNQLTP